MIGAIAAVVGAQAISGLVQAYNSEKARGASQQRLNEIEALYNSMVPPNYDLTIQDPPQLHMEAVKSPQFAAAVQSPSFDTKAFTPEKLKSVGNFVPEFTPFVKEVAPTLIEKNQDMQTGRKAQLTALDKLTKIGEGGFDPEYAQKVQEAESRAQAQAKAQQASLMDSFNRRGIGGSGLELAAALQGNASAMDTAARANQQAATDAYRNQLSALAQGAELGSNIFNQDQNLQAQNASIINSFNQRMSSAQQNWLQQNANTANQANLRNLENQQSLSNQNTANANQAALQDRQRLDDLAKFGYNANIQQQQRQDQLAQQQYQNAVGERNYQNQVAQSLADWQNQQRQQSNAIKQQQFNNQMAINSGKAGIGQTQANNALQAAADRNQAISGIANAATMGALAYQNQQSADEQRQQRYGY